MPFELMLKVELNRRLAKLLNSQPIAIQIQLLNDYEDFEATENNDIKVETSPTTLYINKSGECKFTVTIYAHSIFHGDQLFKLAFSAKENAIKHIYVIIPCETKPFRLQQAATKSCGRYYNGPQQFNNELPLKKRKVNTGRNQIQMPVLDRLFICCGYCKTCLPKKKNKSSHVYRCAQCKIEFYCNVNCQRNDWNIHKLHCDIKEVNNNNDNDIE
eukprot:102944_1